MRRPPFLSEEVDQKYRHCDDMMCNSEEGNVKVIKPLVTVTHVNVRCHARKMSVEY